MEELEQRVRKIEDILRDISTEWDTVMTWVAMQGRKVDDSTYQALEKITAHLQRSW